eukprot:Protomagalhaensia_wolfi_Nauph_80__667@NODE_1380_length_1556_cov_80_906394_g1066_i0_p1_GENE_NODE_1380_length_1556_cov_80_906394_g1066_i0NODE_1380_length_1556_cov_80_906394_g1066_i0_p1_ORF_typecomplete_len392_score61_56ABATE/PF07336_11/3_3e02ABATE/PF07336_11/2_5_NODE_1380_length_1556_cov_80_906394_g1066_i01601335
MRFRGQRQVRVGTPSHQLPYILLAISPFLNEEPSRTQEEEVPVFQEIPLIPVVNEEEQVPVFEEIPLIPEEQVPVFQEIPLMPVVNEEQEVPVFQEIPLVPVVNEEQQVPVFQEIPVVNEDGTFTYPMSIPTYGRLVGKRDTGASLSAAQALISARGPTPASLMLAFIILHRNLESSGNLECEVGLVNNEFRFSLKRQILGDCESAPSVMTDDNYNDYVTRLAQATLFLAGEASGGPHGDAQLANVRERLNSVVSTNSSFRPFVNPRSNFTKEGGGCFYVGTEPQEWLNLLFPSFPRTPTRFLDTCEALDLVTEWVGLTHAELELAHLQELRRRTRPSRGMENGSVEATKKVKNVFKNAKNMAHRLLRPTLFQALLVNRQREQSILVRPST